MGRKLMHRIICVIALACVPAASAGPASAHDSDSHPSDEFYTNPPSWNGKKIYLSPAHHWQGKKYGCGAYVEDDNMLGVARAAGILDDGGSLWDRGYKVRVGRGDPDDNVARSNKWGSTRHIALHSNAHANSTGCGFSNGGTIGFYYAGSSQGENLAYQLRRKVGASSPGDASEKIETAGFYELSYASMPAAYLEAEFHDWWSGKNWLQNYSSWDYRIDWAVDVHLGYP